jgi:hypothetical protein
MASNRKPQSVNNVFSQQANGAVTERLQRFDGQDKTALRSSARSQPLNNNPERTKKHGSNKRKTVHLVLWVNPIVKAELQRIAKQEGLSMSRAGGELLERSLQQNIDMQYSDYSKSSCFWLLGKRPHCQHLGNSSATNTSLACAGGVYPDDLPASFCRFVRENGEEPALADISDGFGESAPC